MSINLQSCIKKRNYPAIVITEKLMRGKANLQLFKNFIGEWSIDNRNKQLPTGSAWIFFKIILTVEKSVSFQTVINYL